jgi:cathepsin L
MVFPTFAAWAATFGKVYNGDEIVTREAIYNANVAMIQEHNDQGSSWTMDVNEFADLTEEEFLAAYTGAELPADTDEPAFEVEVDEPVADALDWVQKGVVNPIKNQGQCGSCWAFSTMGTLESGYAIATGKLVSVAEQQLVDCDKSNNGCSGGWPHTAYDSYLSRVGVCSESSYTYTARGGSCRASSCSNAISKGVVIGHSNVGKSSSSLKSTLSRQPVSVTVNAGQLQFYANGVVTHPCSGQINHAVIAVGYGTDGVDYFKIRNSWGTGWGESGYIRIGQNGGSQGAACLFQYSPVTPTLSVSPSPTPTPTPSPTPSPTPTPTPTPTPGHCHAISPVATDDWCNANCAMGNCPADLCKCDGIMV